MKKYFLPILLSLFAAYFLFSPILAKAYVDSMTYSGTITINNSGNASTLTDYQISVTIDTSALITASRMQSDCDDIRFVDSDNTTKLSYWLESGCNTTTTKFWVKVPSIPGSSSKTIYTHFGNNSASSESSGSNTFIFFDDFSTLNSSTWTATNAPTATVSGGVLTVTQGSLYSNSTLASQTGTIVESRMAWATSSAHAGMQIGDSTATASSNSTNKKVAYILSPGDGGVVASAGFTGYNIVSSTQLKVPGTSSTGWSMTNNQYWIIGFGFDSARLYYFRDYGYHANNVFTGAGPWSAPYYVWFGHFSGSNAGTTDGTNVLVDWVRVRKFITPSDYTAGNEPVISTNVGVTPSAPQTFAVTGGNQKAVLTWTAPASGSGITDYVIETSTDGSSYSTFADGTSTSTTATVTGLTNGTTYYFRVYAVNGVGNGTATSAVTARITNDILHGVLMTGQSHSIGYNGYPALTTTQPYFNLKLNSDYTKFTPLIEDRDVGDDYVGATESPMSSFANTITSLSSGTTYQTAILNNAVGGYAYSQLKKGTSPYSNGITYLTTANTLSGALNRTFQVDAVVNIHGPADRTRANEYEGYLNEWQSDYQTDIKAITGQSANIPMFIDQSSNFVAYGTPTSDLVIAQLAADENNSNIYMVTPKYHLYYGPDWVHLTNESYRLLGEYFGKAVKRIVVEGESFVALTPAEQVRKDNVITVRFNVPEEPLAFDTTNVLSKTNYGFEFYDDSGSTPAITGVSLFENDSVRITLASTPTGATQKIRYAYTGTGGVKPGAMEAGAARGNLRDSDTTKGPSNVNLYNWAVHFDKPVTLDNTPPVISNFVVDATETSAAISWNINERSIETFNYGLTSDYTTSTDFTRDTTHDLVISDLYPCSIYHYQIVSTDLAGNQRTSDDATFTTSGCSGDAEVEASSDDLIGADTGGSVELMEASKGIELTIPVDYKLGRGGIVSSFQIKRLNKESALEEISTPANYSIVAQYLYDLKALEAFDTPITDFDEPVTITMTYGDSEISGMSESSLKIYRWNGSTWNQLTDCTVNTSANTVTCSTEHFSVFGLFGQASSGGDTPTDNDSSDDEDEEDSCKDEVGTRPSWLYSAVAVDFSSIKLQFTEAAEPVEYYSIKYGLSSNNYNESKENIGIKSKSRMEYVVENLAPNTTYYFRIRGNNGCKFGDWSNEIKATTKGKFTFNNLQFTNSTLEPVSSNDTSSSTTSSDNNQDSNSSTSSTQTEEGYKVKVTVVDENKNPVEGAKVTMHSKIQEATTDKNGIAIFTNVEQGDHRVIIAYDGYEGEQSINLTGDVKEFSLEITIKSQNVATSPLYLWSVGILIAGIIFLIFLLMRKKQ